MAGRDPRARGEPMPATLVERRDLGPTLAIFRFEPEGGVPAFDPGQYVPLGIRTGGDRVLWRPYSIASPPEEERFLELYVRRFDPPEEGPHFTPLLWEMRPGDRLLWKPPRGTFAFSDFHPDGTPDERLLLLIAGGTGVAPFVSCALHRRHLESERPIVLCHGARYVAELGYGERLEELERESEDLVGRWGFRYLPTISRPHEPANAGWTGHVGRVDALLRRPEDGAPSAVERAIGAELDPSAACAYVCGFRGTIDATLAVLEPLGFRPQARDESHERTDVRWESYG